MHKKILISLMMLFGSFTQLAAVRLTELDVSFGVDRNGIVTSNINNNDAAISDIGIRSDGIIVAGGTSGSDLIVAWYTPDGQLDTNFGLSSSGVFTLSAAVGTRFAVSAIDIDGSNNIVVTGAIITSTGSTLRTWRVLADGSALDTAGFSFPNGFVDIAGGVAGSGSIGNDIVVDGSGNIVVVGSRTNSTTGIYEIVLMRYLSTGILDPTFGNSGTSGNTVNTLGTGIQGFSLALDGGSSADLYVGGVATVSGNQVGIVGHYVNNGVVDGVLQDGSSAPLSPAYGTAGFAQSTITDVDAYRYTSITIDTSSRIVAAGQADDAVIVSRYTTTGAFDTAGFNTALGYNIFPIGGSSQFNSVAIEPATGLIVAGGESDGKVAVARYTTAGIFDTTFATDGVIITNLPSEEESAQSVAIKPAATVPVSADDLIVIGGFSEELFLLLRFAPNNTTGSVGIVVPADGSTLTAASTPVSGTASESFATITVDLDGTTFATVITDENGNWNAGTSPERPAGLHTFTATMTTPAATDTSTVTFPALADTIQIDSPLDGATVNGTTVVISGSSNVAGGTVDVSIDGVVVAAGLPTNANGEWTTATITDISEGPHTVLADLNAGSATDTITIFGSVQPQYVSAVDTTTQAITTPGTFQNITFNTAVNVSSDWSFTPPSADFTCNQTGLYLIEYDASVARNGGSNNSICSIIAELDTTTGAALTGSPSHINVFRNQRGIRGVNSFIAQINETQVLRLRMTSTPIAGSTNVSLFPAGVAGIGPGVQTSVSLTITRIR